VSVRVLTEARSKALVPLAYVKARLEIEDADSDASLSLLIGTASSAIVQYLGFDLARQQYEEARSGAGRTRMWLSCPPIDPEQLTVSVDGSAVDDVVVQSAEHGKLFLSSGWTAPGICGEQNVVAGYFGGYLLPDDVTAWSAETAIEAGIWTRSSSGSVLRFECTTQGTSGATEPDWPTTAGETVADGDAVWTARSAYELPEAFYPHVYGLVLRDVKVGQIPPGMTSFKAGDVEGAFSVTLLADSLPSHTKNFLDEFATGRGHLA
jgi:hypothetical protein